MTDVLISVRVLTTGSLWSVYEHHSGRRVASGFKTWQEAHDYAIAQGWSPRL